VVDANLGGRVESQKEPPRKGGGGIIRLFEKNPEVAKLERVLEGDLKLKQTRRRRSREEEIQQKRGQSIEHFRGADKRTSKREKSATRL